MLVVATDFANVGMFIPDMSHFKLPLRMIISEIYINCISTSRNRYNALKICKLITSRRLNFLKEILSRKNSDLIYRIFAAQYENPLKGDFVKLIEDNFKLINEKFDMKFIKGMSKKKFKKSVKGKVRKSCL